MDDIRTIDVVFADTSSTAGRNPAIPISPLRSVGPSPIENQICLYNDIHIGKCSEELWTQVFAACRPAGFSHSPCPQFGQRYAFWNRNPAEPSGYDWDSDHSLQTAVALSRLVHPTSIGLEYSARVKLHSTGQVKEIIPGPVNGPLAQAYVADTATHNWLTEADAKALRQLLGSFYAVSADLPPRLRRALWNHEYAAVLSWMEVRWTVVATALEALIHTDRERSTKQFVNRVTALATRVGVDFSHRDAEQAYDYRSSLAHGDGIGDSDDAVIDLYCRMEAVLRASIRAALEDITFRDIFRDKEQIRGQFPLT